MREKREGKNEGEEDDGEERRRRGGGKMEQMRRRTLNTSGIPGVKKHRLRMIRPIMTLKPLLQAESVAHTNPR